MAGPPPPLQNVLPPIGGVVVSSGPYTPAPAAPATATATMGGTILPIPGSNADFMQLPVPGPLGPMDALPQLPMPPPADTMRAYRACLNCRNRKSKCDLDPNFGRPPCRRCQRENKECILGESHRGGRRVRKKPKLEDGSRDSEPPATPSSSSPPKSEYSPHPGPQLPPPSQDFHHRYEGRAEQGYTWQPQTSIARSGPRPGELQNLINPRNENQYRPRMDSTISLAEKSGDRVHEGIASADLQNPSDALEILAQVADRADDENSQGSEQIAGQQRTIWAVPPRHEANSRNMDDYWSYKPLQDSLISSDMVFQLFQSYKENFHPFFPIIPRETFDRTRLPWLSRHEPHLFSAILTVASKDDERVHQICYDHMQQKISMILAGADANVEAVEALLLLSQWVSHRPQASIAVGRGEEDRVAWMYIGTALRLGYFLGLDRTSFRSDSSEDPAKFNRKRLVWSACYMCDRQVSVRVGKGFWSRGPGPLSGLRSTDFPTLLPGPQQNDDFAQIFQANLELTQIFSNVHDILYSSKGHGWTEMLEGRYAKYLDDFRSSIRSWHDVWGTLICSPRLKTSLLLTYDYLRLYVNAFAYQATISRAVNAQKNIPNNSNKSIPLINATAPDARFIYEALDAAKSLLSNFNNFVEPQILRYMPSPYYLFIIYSAVFLYKARSTTTMTDEERTGVRHMINQTIERLQKATVGANQMGNRYARLLQLLWRKPPKRNGQDASHRQSIDGRLAAGSNDSSVPNNSNNSKFDPSISYESEFGPPGVTSMGNGGGAPGFSWLNLEATWNYATQNGNTNSSSGSASDPQDDGGLGGLGDNMSPFDMALLTDYTLLEGDNSNFIF